MVKPIAVEYRRSGYAGALRTYVEAMKQLSQSMYVSPAQMAMIYTAMGDKEEAFRWLELGRQQRDGWMVYLAVEPAYDPLRDDPRFEKLLAASMQRHGIKEETVTPTAAGTPSASRAAS